LHHGSSKAVSRLEARLGARLINRTSRRLALTDAGRQLAGRAAQILAAGEAAEDAALAQATRPLPAWTRTERRAALSAKTLMRKASRLPAEWMEQRALLGFWKIWPGKHDSRALMRTIYLRTHHCSLECNKKVNHEMPAERFSSSLAPRYRAYFVSAANWTRERVKNRRAKWRQNRRRQRAKTTALSIASTLADDAVSCEPVSAPNSLLTGKLTGNFAESGPPLPFRRPVSAWIQWLPAEFPTERNREFLNTYQGIFSRNREFAWVSSEPGPQTSKAIDVEFKS
jgi:hypothetical protein